MKSATVQYLFLLLFICISAGCANIVPPSGGKKDTTPPKLISVTPKDSLLNAKVGKIDLRFDEYITVADVSNEVQVSPLLSVPVSMLALNKKATLKLPDTLLLPNTTYRVSFGKSIKDLHEGNPIAPYTYTFSTGSYFDSLQLTGFVYDAITGLPDSGSTILLYPATLSDSAVVRQKPLYIGRVLNGSFAVKGLPGRAFRIYAMKDANANLIFDGKDEKIGFIDSIVMPVSMHDTAIGSPIVLNVFKEVSVDTTIPITPAKSLADRAAKKADDKNKQGFLYTVGADTSNIKKRSLDVTKPLRIQFNQPVDSIYAHRIYLSYDSSDISVESILVADTDTVKNNVILIHTKWKEDAVYTLRLLKGFAKDTAGNDAMPSKYIFRTQADEDYSKLNIHLPSKYYGKKYILLVKNETDTVHFKTVTDTMVHLVKLKPAGYTMSIIVDENENSKWDTGDLLGKKQPEAVIPYGEVLVLKAGWENTTDFEKPVKTGIRSGVSPETREKPFRK